MSRNSLLEKLITNVVKDSRIVGSSKKTDFWLNKNLLDFNGQLLSFSSYNPNFKMAKDLIGNSFEYDIETSSVSLNKQLCLIPKRDTKYLTFKDSYYILFKDRSFMNSFILSDGAQINNNNNNGSRGANIILTNNDIRSKLKPENDLNSFLNYYIRLFNTLHDYNNNNCENVNKLTSKDISSVNDIIHIHNSRLQPILNNSLLLWNYPTSHLGGGDTEIKDMFWYYKIENCVSLYNNPNENSGTTLHYVSFENNLERNKFKLNLHGTILQNGSKLLIETL